jgi:hypothetical protein
VIHVRLVDFAELPKGVEAQAESLVAGVFRRAGLELDFVDAAPKADFWLQILKQRPRLHGDTTGFAVLVRSDRTRDSYAAVSWPIVEAAAHDLGAPEVELLAAAMAHELGHLLLHSSVHSHSGLMKPRLDRAQIDLLERGELNFTREEVARIVERRDRSGSQIPTPPLE